MILNITFAIIAITTTAITMVSISLLQDSTVR